MLFRSPGVHLRGPSQSFEDRDEAPRGIDPQAAGAFGVIPGRDLLSQDPRDPEASGPWPTDPNLHGPSGPLMGRGLAR